MKNTRTVPACWLLVVMLLLCIAPCVFGQVSFHYTVKHTRHACASNRALIH